MIILENIYQGPWPECQCQKIYSKSADAENPFNDGLRSERQYNIIEEPQSDYEAIDTTLFGWWKAKLRKSQIRKVYFGDNIYKIGNKTFKRDVILIPFLHVFVYCSSLSDPHRRTVSTPVPEEVEEVKDGLKLELVGYQPENQQNL